MDRLDLWILAVLHNQQADSYQVAMSISEIMNDTDDISRIAVYKHLKKLLKSDLIAIGPKDSRADCYFITKKGREELLGKKGGGNGC